MIEIMNFIITTRSELKDTIERAKSEAKQEAIEELENSHICTSPLRIDCKYRFTKPRSDFMQWNSDSTVYCGKKSQCKDYEKMGDEKYD